MTPGLVRAIACTQLLLTIGLSRRFSKDGMTVGCIMSGRKTSGAVPISTPKNSAGVTPTMVNGMAERRIVRPTTDGSRANRRSQYPWLSIATGCPFGTRSSSGPRALPIAGLTPNNEK